MSAGSIANYKSRLRIDTEALSECLVEQPQLYYDVATELARARARVDAIKLDVEETQARVDREIREQAIAAGVKITEAAIQQQTKLDDRIEAVTRSHLEAREDLERWQAMRDAFSQRSFMLRELVSLHVSERHEVAQALGSGQQQARARSAADQMVDCTIRETAPARQRYRARRGASDDGSEE